MAKIKGCVAVFLNQKKKKFLFFVFLFKQKIRPRRFELLQISHQEIILPLNHDLKFKLYIYGMHITNS